jgi:peroxiredoxin
MFTLPIGSSAPDFNLTGSDGKAHDFASVKGESGTLIFFTCNHCPYVVGSEARMKDLFAEITPRGISMVAIHSNETADHPTDAFPFVIERMKEMGFGWLSLDDGQQFVAKEYGATRTPHYFLFDKQGVLAYTGRMDNSPRDATRAETNELRDAIDDMLNGRPVRLAQTDAIGCNVKWWDKEKHWMPGDACDLDYLYQKFGKN